MLSSVQPVSFRSFASQCQPNIPSFKGDPNELTGEQEMWKGISEQVEDLLNDENLPKPVRKFSKFLKVVSSGVLTALGVIWASKKAGTLVRSAVTSQFAKGLKDKLRSAYKFVKEPAKKVFNWVKDLVVKNFDKTKDKGFMKKIVDKFNSLKNGNVGNFVSKIGKNLKDFGNWLKGIFTNLKGKFTFDGVNKAVANTMGVGSGAAAAYETAKAGGGQ